MLRTVVRRIEATESININDEIGLDCFLDYTLQEHLEDLASDGLAVVGSHGDVYVFSDYSVRILREVEEGVDVRRLDQETRKLYFASTPTRSDPQWARATLLA